MGSFVRQKVAFEWLNMGLTVASPLSAMDGSTKSHCLNSLHTSFVVVFYCDEKVFTQQACCDYMSYYLLPTVW